MTDMVRVNLKGYEGLRALLREVPEETKIQALRPGVRGMGNFTLFKAREKAGQFIKGYSTGAIKRNIKLLVKREDVPWKVVAGLRVKTARKQTIRRGDKGRGPAILEGFLRGEKAAKAKGADDPYYWFMVEFGTVHMQAQPFLRPALENYRDAHINLFRTKFSGALLRVIAKAYGKQRRAAAVSILKGGVA
jgi:HK97 gp10 family phage protein